MLCDNEPVILRSEHWSLGWGDNRVCVGRLPVGCVEGGVKNGQRGCFGGGGTSPKLSRKNWTYHGAPMEKDDIVLEIQDKKRRYKILTITTCKGIY